MFNLTKTVESTKETHEKFVGKECLSMMKTKDVEKMNGEVK